MGIWPVHQTQGQTREGRAQPFRRDDLCPSGPQLRARAQRVGVGYAGGEMGRIY